MSRKYKLVRITPEEYLTIGEAGGWVLAWDKPWSDDEADVNSETKWGHWKQRAGDTEYLYTRIEIEE